MWWSFPWRNLSWGKRIFMKGGAGFLSIFSESNEKINMKKFLQLKVRVF